MLVGMEATSVNPIDAKRASDYGRRLLGLKRAATLPLVLGNEIAGVAEAIRAGVSCFRKGERAFGLVATGKHGGAHATYVVAPAEHLAPASAAGVRVLINGASDALGRLALQTLRAWGCHMTAIRGRDEA